ncbi:MAG: hypothetical protein ACLFPS_09685 [Clostridia bacterium]
MADIREYYDISKEELAKGGSKKAFRKLKEWTVKNKILYGILFSYDIKLSDFAEMIGVSSRAVQRWVFEGKSPNRENRKKICELLDYPEYILFYDIKKESE